MKKWNTPEMEVLEVSATANGAAPNDNYDGEWVQIGDRWYLPGDGTANSSTTA